jgi:hypothetical protein
MDGDVAARLPAIVIPSASNSASLGPELAREKHFGWLAARRGLLALVFSRAYLDIEP